MMSLTYQLYHSEAADNNKELRKLYRGERPFSLRSLTRGDLSTRPQAFRILNGRNSTLWSLLPFE